ncbi:MAG TPA: proline dehydrogenase family protein [Gemmatimonadaceae bacterium]|jgi:proline dehydrogenase
MSIARTLLLRASRSSWLEEQFRRRSFARRAVRRFMPGEDVGSALDAAAALAPAGIGSVLTALGERVNTREEAEEVRRNYDGVLDAIRARALPAHVSVKLTHLGLDVDRALCTESVQQLADRAAATGTMLWIDIEESHYVDATLEIYRAVRARQSRIGVCLQAYLRRTPTDLASVLGVGGSVRLVKGAYAEPPEIAFPRKADTDAAYFALAQRMLEVATPNQPQVFGTHDLALLDRVKDRASALKLPKGAWEVHMLYGIQSAAQRSLAANGVSVRCLISYGTRWFPWYVRRLAERPANVWFVLRSMVTS